MRKFIKKYISPFFGTDAGKLNVPYFWSTLFLSLTAWCIISIIIFDRTGLISLVAIMAGLVLGMIATYNYGKLNRFPTQKNDPETAKKFDSNQEGPKS